MIITYDLLLITFFLFYPNILVLQYFLSAIVYTNIYGSIIDLIDRIHTIPDSTYRLYLDRSLEFFADIFHMSIDRTIVDIVIIPDDIFHE